MSAGCANEMVWAVGGAAGVVNDMIAPVRTPSVSAPMFVVPVVVK
jgi:hypothetical protein